MTYGKLINGNIVPAPNPLPVGGSRVYNPSAALYVAHGWLPIIDTPMPDTPEGEEPKYYTYHREVVDGQIVRVWTETEPPEPETALPAQPTPEERIAQLEGSVKVLSAKMEMQSQAQTFLEDCVLEMGDVVYA